jgi:hypothetical protein
MTIATAAIAMYAAKLKRLFQSVVEGGIGCDKTFNLFV